MDSEQRLGGQTILVIGGSSGIGLETARRAREEGADVIITARDPDRLLRAGLELGASIAAFDATDFDRLERFFDELPGPIDHLLLSCGRPYSCSVAELDFDEARRNVERHFWLPLQLARLAKEKVRPEGTLLLLSGTEWPQAAAGPLSSAFAAALPALTKSLALELAPVRVNLIAVSPADVAALAMHLMMNTADTGATFDIEGGQKLGGGRVAQS